MLIVQFLVGSFLIGLAIHYIIGRLERTQASWASVFVASGAGFAAFLGLSTYLLISPVTLPLLIVSEAWTFAIVAFVTFTGAIKTLVRLSTTSARVGWPAASVASASVTIVGIVLPNAVLTLIQQEAA